MTDKEKITGFIKKYKPQILCVAGSLILFMAAALLKPGRAEDVNVIERAGYGSRKTESLYVEGLEKEPVQVDIAVEARKFREDEIDNAMERCKQDVILEAIGDNPSEKEIYHDMELPDRSREYGFDLTWTSDNADVITSAGTVKNEELKKPEEVNLFLNVSDGEHENEYVIPLVIMPQYLTDSEKRMNGLLSKIADADRKAATEPEVELPKNYEGRELRFRNSEDMSYNFIWILGIVFAVLLLLRDKENSKTEQEKRYRQMELDYPEIVSKLLVFVGAGMSVRTAWDAIASDYEVSHSDGEGEVRYAYEELCRSNTRLKTGAPEGVVYREYGRECRSKQYMKLASLLEQNRKSGLANMKSLLQLEMVEAWEERKNLALRQGEEASTKLVIPLIIMLVIVMVIIMVPALMGFL